MIGTAVSSSLVSLLGVVGATLVILVLILWMSVIILKVSIVDMLSKLINDYKLEKEKHQTEMRLLREQREKEVEKITEPPKNIQKMVRLEKKDYITKKEQAFGDYLHLKRKYLKMMLDILMMDLMLLIFQEDQKKRNI